MVVVKFVFVFYFFDDGIVESSGFVGCNFGIKSNVDEVYLLYGVWFLWLLKFFLLDVGFIWVVVGGNWYYRCRCVVMIV